MSVTINRSKLTLSNSKLNLQLNVQAQSKVADLEVNSDLTTDIASNGSINPSESRFILDPAIQAKLESGILDKKLEKPSHNNGRLIEGLLSNEHFGNDLGKNFNRYGNLGRNYFDEATDISGYADRNSALNRVGSAGTARMNGGTTERSSQDEDQVDDYGFCDDYTFELDEDGNVIGWENDDEGDPIEETRENLGPAEDSEGSEDPTSSNATETPNSTEDSPGLLESIDGCTTKTEDAFKAATVTAGATIGQEADLPGAILGGIIGWAVAETVCVVDDVKEWIYKNPNPMDDSATDPNSTPFKDHLGILDERDGLINRIRIVNPEINPFDEGSSGDSSNYVNQTLASIGISDGGTSTGAWDVQGGDYLGPSLQGAQISIGGTSTGTDWL